MITTGLCILAFSCLLLVARMMFLERRINALEHYGHIDLRRLENIEGYIARVEGGSKEVLDRLRQTQAKGKNHLTHEDEWVPPVMKHRDIKS